MLFFQINYLRTFWNQSPIQARLFVVIGIFFGLFFIFCSPPMKSPDEPQHYYRSYEISSGDLVANKSTSGRYGFALPDNMANFGEKFLLAEESGSRPDQAFMRQLFKEKPAKYKRDVYFENSAVYSPIAYIPQSFGLVIGNAFNLSILTSFYLSRFFNFLFWLILIFIAIRLAPFGRWVLFTVALLPMSIYQAASLSPDAAIISVSILAISLFLYLYKTAGIKNIHIIVVAGLMTFITLVKPTYLVIGLLFLLIPRNKFKSLKTYFIWLASSLVLPSLTALCWLFFSWPISKKLVDMFQLGNSVSSSAQIHFIFNNPLHYIGTLLNSVLFDQFIFLTKGTLGVLGWGKILLPAYCYILISFTIIIGLLLEISGNNANHPSRRQKFILIITSILLSISICTSLYISFTPVSSSAIQGLQGRYFIPALSLLLIGLIPDKKLVIKNNVALIVLLLLIIFIVQCIAIVTLLNNTYLLAA